MGAARYSVRKIGTTSLALLAAGGRREKKVRIRADIIKRPPPVRMTRARVVAANGDRDRGHRKLRCHRGHRKERTYMKQKEEERRAVRRDLLEEAILVSMDGSSGLIGGCTAGYGAIIT